MQNDVTPGMLGELARIGTPTISGELTKLGLRRTFMPGLRQLVGSEPLAAPAFNIRFLPAREDITTPDSYATVNNLSVGIEEVPAGSFAVIDARGDRTCGVLGDIIAARMKAIGITGVIVDGMIRDAIGVRKVGLPIWAIGYAAPTTMIGLQYAGAGGPVGCAGVLVEPGDIIVADEEAVLAVPRAVVASIFGKLRDQIVYEEFVLSEIAEGGKLRGLYPLNDQMKAQFEAWKEAGSAR